MTTMKLNRAVTRIQKLRAAKGGWAIEATGALGLLVMLVGFSMYNETRGNDRKTAEIAATHHKTVSTAASSYVRDHYSDLLAAVPAVGNTTTVSFATLQANGYLQPTLSSSNIWGQTLTLRVRRLSADPKAVQLEALVIGEGGRAVGHELAREVSQNIGAEGGYTVASGDYCGTTRVGASTLCGTRGVWQRPVADFDAAIPAGHIASALFFKDGMAVNDYLYRHRVPGKPELNTMETYLQMGVGTRATEGQPCYSVAGDTSSPLLDTGAIATTSDGLILSCQSGAWRSIDGRETGIRGIFKPLAGKTISCYGAKARVLSNGQPQVRNGYGANEKWINDLVGIPTNSTSMRYKLTTSGITIYTSTGGDADNAVEYFCPWPEV